MTTAANNQGTRVLDLTAKSSISSSNDQIVIVYAAGSNNAQTALVSVKAMFANALVNTAFADPANSAATTVLPNTIIINSNNIYVATANNHLKRVALSDF